MTPQRRTEMVAQIVPFLGAFLAELLRAINLSQMPGPPESEVIEDDEHDEQALLQNTQYQLSVPEARSAKNALEDDTRSLMQAFDPSIPFGSKLSQLQAHFEQLRCHTMCSSGQSP